MRPVPSAPAILVEPLSADIVTLAQCMAIDADAFPYSSVQFGLALRDPGARVWIAREASHARARALAFLAAFHASRVLRIVGLAVDRAHRGRGLARALLRAAVTSARASGTQAVRLHVAVGNAPAIALYRSEGFEVTRRAASFYAPGVYPGGRDALEMVLSIGA